MESGKKVIMQSYQTALQENSEKKVKSVVNHMFHGHACCGHGNPHPPWDFSGENRWFTISFSESLTQRQNPGLACGQMLCHQRQFMKGGVGGGNAVGTMLGALIQRSYIEKMGFHSGLQEAMPPEKAGRTCSKSTMEDGVKTALWQPSRLSHCSIFAVAMNLMTLAPACFTKQYEEGDICGMRQFDQGHLKARNRQPRAHLYQSMSLTSV